ncbi:hypothetical protein BUE80_DR000704, partial [Diplocarpon rosae]
MDVFYMEPGVQDSRQCSAKSTGYLPSTASPFHQAIDLPENASANEPAAAGTTPSGIVPGRSNSSQGYLDHGAASHPSPEPSISAPVPQQYTLLSLFEMNDQFVPPHQSLGHEPSTHFLYDEPKLLPMYSRSLTSSPQPNFTAEQRDLKRQRDYSRREAKSRMRRERSTSRPNSSRSSLYLGSQHNSPDMMPRSVPEYTSNLTPSPLLSQASLQSSPGLDSVVHRATTLSPRTVRARSREQPVSDAADEPEARTRRVGRPRPSGPQPSQAP